MAFLLGLVSALILYGTLYPFDFSIGVHPGGVVNLLIESIKVRPGRGDVLSNVVLFLPFGFFAMQSLFPKMPRFLRLVLITLIGGLFSLSIEAIQVNLPDRVTSIYDLTLNAFGTFVGAVVGWPDWRRELGKLQSDLKQPMLFPILLFGAWAGYRLFPYVPTIDLQHVKDALKPLLTMNFPPADVMRHFVVTLVVGCILKSMMTPGRALIGMVIIPFGVIAAKPFIMTKVIMPAEVAGVGLAVAVWVLALGRLRWSAGIVALPLAAQIVAQGVLPWALRPEVVAFSFIPFIGFEGGSMAVNLQAFLEKIFLYGALIWLLVESGRGIVVSILSAVILLTGVELAQMYLVDRLSEITDPILAIAMGLALYFVDLRERRTPETQRAATAKLV